MRLHECRGDEAGSCWILSETRRGSPANDFVARKFNAGARDVSVYVDALIVWGGDEAPRCFRHKPSCHLYADTLEELHAFALRIGMRRAWFQNHPTVKHYDLTAPKRQKAIALGAIEHDRRQSVDKWNELRED